MATIQKSMRVPEELIKEIQSIGLESGKDFSAITKELLEEAIKMRRCPGIIFTEGTSGRRARIAGSGTEVWVIIAGYESVSEVFERLRGANHWLTEQQLRAAIGYWKTYPEEIDRLITQNERWTKECIHERYPFLGRLGS